MIEQFKCKGCGYSSVDMKFYRVGKEVAICPKCNSEEIEVLSEEVL